MRALIREQQNLIHTFYILFWLPCSREDCWDTVYRKVKLITTKSRVGPVALRGVDRCVTLGIKY